MDEIEDDWDVLGFDNTSIRLADIDDDDADYLTFSRPSDGGDDGGDDTSGLSSVIATGTWRVGSYIDSGTNETSDYSGIVLEFREDGSILATRGDDAFSGTWSTSQSNGAEKLTFNFGDSQPLDEFNDDWDVVSFAATRIELRDVSGGDGSTDTLILEKNG